MSGVLVSLFPGSNVTFLMTAGPSVGYISGVSGSISPPTVPVAGNQLTALYWDELGDPNETIELAITTTATPLPAFIGLSIDGGEIMILTTTGGGNYSILSGLSPFIIGNTYRITLMAQ